MIVLYIILILAGAFPLLAFLYKRREHNHILRSGAKTNAVVTSVKTNLRQRGVGANYDSVVFTYRPRYSNQYYTGSLMAKIDQYKTGDEIEIYYLPDKPHKKAMVKMKYNMVGFIFVCSFFLAVLFACYKIHEMLNTL